MELLLEFIGNHPILAGAFAVVVAAIIATESARLVRRWRELETVAAIRLINREDPLILDASNSTDYARAHILNAVHVPSSQVESGNQRLLKHRDRPVLVYCKNGQLSPQVATRLTKMGFEQVYLLKGGLAQWLADNQPVTRARGAGKPGGKGKDKNKKKHKGGNNRSGEGKADADGAAEASQPVPSDEDRRTG